MTMEYVRKTYNVPAKRGMRVEIYYRPYGFSGRWRFVKAGRISSASHYIYVDSVSYHPTHGIVYLDEDGTVILDTRKGEE